MTVSPNKAYQVLGRSLLTIGNYLRENQPNRKAGYGERTEFNRRVFEGTLLENLDAAASVNAPAKARFRIKSLIQDSDALANDREVEVWSRNTSVSYSAGEFGWAFEQYRNVFYFYPLSAGAQPRDAITTECLGDGWYRVELGEFPGYAPAPTGSGSLAAGACDLCDETDLGAVGSTGITGDCETPSEVTIARPIPTGSGVFVYAHDAEVSPLEIGGHCRIIRMPGQATSGSVAGSVAGSGSAAASSGYWAIFSGKRRMARLPFPNFQCCTDPVTGTQFVQMVSCVHAIGPVILCNGGTDPCPDGSV